MKNLKGKLSGTARILTDAELGQVSGGDDIVFQTGSTIVVQRPHRTKSISGGVADDCLD